MQPLRDACQPPTQGTQPSLARLGPCTLARDLGRPGNAQVFYACLVEEAGVPGCFVCALRVLVYSCGNSWEGKARASLER